MAPLESPAPAALVTGCSSGIGLVTAAALVRRGYCVWAGVRRPESILKLETLAPNILGPVQVSEGENRWRPVRMDVVDPDDVKLVARSIAESSLPLRVVINNAGYGQFGALEDLTEDEFRRQWEVNVAGAWRVIRHTLPLLRESGPGSTIVNVSSILGRLSLPFGGPYAASKFALEALSDALRVEVAPWGIRVVVVEPGPIRTRFNKNALAALDFSRAEGSPYEKAYRKLEVHYRRRERRGELPPSSVTRVILCAIESPRPRTRYLVTFPARAAAWARLFLPDRVIDWATRRYLGI